MATCVSSTSAAVLADTVPTELSFERLHAALAAYEQEPGSVQLRTEVSVATCAVARALVALSKRDSEHPTVIKSLHLIRQLSGSGVHDYAVSEEAREIVASASANQWPAALAMMMLGAAWQWGNPPRLDAVPQWLWDEYTAWVFAAPQGFTAVGDAQRYAQFLLPRLEELAKLVERNLGSASVRAAGEAYLQNSLSIALYFADDSLRQHAELRGRILKRLLARDAVAFEPMVFPRAGRRLRIGFLNRHFGPQTETYTTLPTFEELDPERFEVTLFSLRDSDTELAGYCRGKAQDFRVLPSDFEGQLNALRDANLDVLVFGTNVTAAVHEVTRLALYRIAPLQIANNSSCITTGFPDIDLYVSGDMTETADAPADFTERLGLLPGPAHAFNYSADKQEPTTTWTREALGVPADATVFVTAANYFKVIPEMQQTWAKLLAAIPNSRLLIHPFNPNWSSTYPIKRFCAEFDRALAQHGVATDRLIVSTAKFPSRTDVRELLRIGDVYLDTFPFGGVNSLVDPLEAGLPVVVWEGSAFRSRMGAALVRALQIPELIAAGEPEYLRIATELAMDSTKRAALSTRITSAMERTPIFMDPLAASDAFGDLVEVAFDELAEKGKNTWQTQRNPLTVTSGAEVEASFDSVAVARAALRRSPADPSLRHAYGVALLTMGNAACAAKYLLAAIQTSEANAQMWFDLAQAFRQNGQMQEALQSLEASLRLDVKNHAGWRLVVELAEAVGAYEMVAEASSVLDHLAGNPPAEAVV